jgi:DNA-directed RNA polymerase subunit RPC12/RpoP
LVVKYIKFNILGCGKEQEIRHQDIIVCTDCSVRIFFKKRGNNSSQYEAR